MNQEVRCGNCDQKLGEILPSGDVEVRLTRGKARNDRVIQIRDGALYCGKCDRMVKIQPGASPTTSVSTRGVFRTGEHARIPGRLKQ